MASSLAMEGDLPRRGELLNWSTNRPMAVLGVVGVIQVLVGVIQGLLGVIKILVGIIQLLVGVIQLLVGVIQVSVVVIQLLACISLKTL